MANEEWSIKIRDPFAWYDDEFDYIYEQDGLDSYEEARKAAEVQCVAEFNAWIEGDASVSDLGDVSEAYFYESDGGSSMAEVLNVSRDLEFYVEYEKNE